MKTKQALEVPLQPMLERLANQFPGLVNGYTAVDGADLVEALADYRPLFKAALESEEKSKVDYIEWALRLQRGAQKLLKKGGANRAAVYVARSIKSTEGALRHAERMARKEAQ